MAIGKKNGLDPDSFFTVAQELIHQTGYVTGKSDEAHYWKTLRGKTGIPGADQEYRKEILKRFVLRDQMLRVVKTLRSSGMITAILSDQTNWLDEINKRSPFYYHFDFVFNSYVLKKSKRDPSVFKDVCTLIGIKPRQAIFVDDNITNTKNAESAGLRTIHFLNVKDFEKELANLLR